MDACTFFNYTIIKQILLNKNKLWSQRFAKLMDWTVIIILAVFIKNAFLISSEDLKKSCICISDFGILKARFNKILLLNIDDIILEAFHNSSNSKSTFFDFDINIF